VLWKFFVINNGNLTATNVVVENDVTGLAVNDYAADGPGISLSSTLPITDDVVTFLVDEIGPNEQRAVTVTADVIRCHPLYVTITARLECLGVTCQERQAEISFDTPDPYLLTNNGETADLPMCDVGNVIFTVKNASPDVTLYRLDITETLRNLLPVPGAPITVVIEDDQHTTIASTIGFTPTLVYSGTDLFLTWRAADAPTEVYTWFNALPPLYIVRIYVPVNTTCDPPNTPQSFAQAAALGPCGNHLGYTEDALTLRTLKPDMTVLKQGRAPNGSWGKTIYATPGQTVTWRLEVDNRNTGRSYVAHNVVLTDTWPDTFGFITATLDFTPTINLLQRTITWTIGDVYPQADPLVFLITGTVNAPLGACAAGSINRTRLTFGCGDGCTSEIVPIDTAQLESNPDLRVSIEPIPIQACSGDVPIRIRNYGAMAYSTVLTITMPPGYLYDGYTAGLTPTQVVSTDLTAPVFKWDEIPGRPGSSDSPYEFLLTLHLRSSGTSGGCPMWTPQPVTATLSFDNHPVCNTPGPWTEEDSDPLTVRSPDLRTWEKQSPGPL